MILGSTVYFLSGLGWFWVFQWTAIGKSESSGFFKQLEPVT